MRRNQRGERLGWRSWSVAPQPDLRHGSRLLRTSNEAAPPRLRYDNRWPIQVEQ